MDVPTFDFDKYLLESKPGIGPTGVAFSIPLLNRIIAIRIPLWDFTHSRSMAKKTNAARAVLERSHANPATSFALRSKQSCDLFVADALSRQTSLEKAPLLKLKERYPSYKVDINALCLELSQSNTGLFPGYWKQLTACQAYLSPSSATILHVLLPSYRRMKRCLEKERQSIAWRLRFANHEHVNAYAEYLRDYALHLAEDERQIATACLYRLNMTVTSQQEKSDDFVWDCIQNNLYHVRPSRDENPTCREGLTAKRLVQLHQFLIDLNKSDSKARADAFSELYEKSKKHHAEFYAVLQQFECRNHRLVLTSLVDVIPTYPRWPGWLFHSQNRLHEFISGQAIQSLFKNAILLAKASASGENRPSLKLWAENIRQLDRLSDSKCAVPNVHPLIAWWSGSHQRFAKRWSTYLATEKSTTKKRILQQAKHFASPETVSQILTQEKLPEVEAYFDTLSKFYKNYKESFSEDQCATFIRALSNMEARIKQLVETPSRQRSYVANVMDQLLDPQKKPSESDKCFLVAFYYKNIQTAYQEPPNEVRTQQTDEHWQHFQQNRQYLLSAINKNIHHIASANEVKSGVQDLAKLREQIEMLLRLGIQENDFHELHVSLRKLLLLGFRQHTTNEHFNPQQISSWLGQFHRIAGLTSDAIGRKGWCRFFNNPMPLQNSFCLLQGDLKDVSTLLASRQESQFLQKFERSIESLRIDIMKHSLILDAMPICEVLSEQTEMRDSAQQSVLEPTSSLLHLTGILKQMWFEARNGNDYNKYRLRLQQSILDIQSKAEHQPIQFDPQTIAIRSRL